MLSKISENGKDDKVCEEIILDVHNLKNTPEIIQQIIIREAMARLSIPLKKFGHKHYKEILDLIKSGKLLVNKSIKNCLNVSVNDNTLRISKSLYHVEEKSVLEELELQIPGETKLPNQRYNVKTEIREIKNGFLEEFKQSRTIYDEAIDYDKINTPLTVRVRKEGDRFWPLGSGGIKKLKGFFIDHKIPRMERNTIPIVTMNDQPIWVVGCRIDDRIKITKETRKILIMRFEGVS